MTFTGLVQTLGGLLAFFTLAVLLYGIWRGARQPSGRIHGRLPAWRQAWWFYLAGTLVYLGLSALGWIPLPLNPALQQALLIPGCLLYFPGMGLVLWGRLALGRNYYVSTSQGALLLAGQSLVTGGPYALVRHPMYSGLVLAGLGSLLLYATWTSLFFALFAPVVLLRARHEEAALQAEFGAAWQAYCRRVPAFFPRLWRR
ncbi:MAG TPA: isoprenylcysteine carboxylmethyltransferase family protein [Anaerolineaceae bacterium]|nr:isoprenylcysteine carboxylmethyltransferase family protein [Anaerolineaceae bacterium]HPN51734.1 isoprenylcysteine carboxylmethyltransferase family protein [Anaerolineaceae bacterium]